MTAVVAISTGVSLAAGFALYVGLIALAVWAECRRPLTAQEVRAAHPDAPTDPWKAFTSAGERRRLEAELRDKEEALQDIAVIEAPHAREYVLKKREVA